MYKMFKSAISAQTNELVKASTQGDLNTLYDLIKNGADVNGENEQKVTPIIGACVSGNIYVVKYLVKSGADVNLRSGDVKHSCLGIAAAGGHIKVLEYLLSLGMDIESKNDKGVTAFHEAAIADELATLKYLKSKGAKVDSKVHHMNLSVLTSPAIKGMFDTTKWLLDQGCDLHHKDARGWTLLHYASQNPKALSVLKLLINRGADIHATSTAGQTPLHTATYEGNDEAVRYLIYQGADISTACGDGITPLHYAAIGGSLKCVKILVGKGVTVDEYDRIGGLNLNHAIKQTLSSLCNVLEVDEAITDIVESMEKDLDGHSDGSYVGPTPFILATMKGALPTMKLLKQSGANINVVCSVIGVTALTLACLFGSNEEADWLISAGLDVNHITNTGDTALTLAARAGHLDIVTLLIKNNANVNTRNNKNLTAKDIANKYNHTGIVQKLETSSNITNDNLLS